MRPAGGSLLLAFLLAGCCNAGDLRKLSTLATSTPVRAVSICGQTGIAAAMSRDGSIAVWRVASGEVVSKRPSDKSVRVLACSADAKQLAFGRSDGSVVIADIDGSIRRTLTLGTQRIDDLAFSPDSAVLAVAIHESPVQLWNPSRGVRIAVLETDFSGTHGMDFSPDGARFATADLDTAVRIYDTSGKLQAKYTGLLLEPFAVSFTPDSRQLMVGGADCTLTFLDASDAHVVSTLPKQPDPVFAAAVLPGEAALSLQIDAASLKRFTVLLWDLRTKTARELPIDGRAMVGAGVMANHLPVLFTADSESALTAWTLDSSK